MIDRKFDIKYSHESFDLKGTTESFESMSGFYVNKTNMQLRA